MAIANQTTNEVYALAGAMGNTLQSVLAYRSESRNPAMAAGVDTQLAALKTLLDAAVADATPTPDA